MKHLSHLCAFLAGLLLANMLLTVALLNGYLARPSWIIPSDSMVVAKDFIAVMEEKKK